MIQDGRKASTYLITPLVDHGHVNIIHEYRHGSTAGRTVSHSHALLYVGFYDSLKNNFKTVLILTLGKQRRKKRVQSAQVSVVFQQFCETNLEHIRRGGRREVDHLVQFDLIIVLLHITLQHHSFGGALFANQ